ncbi:MAG TPA: PIN domain-containing protein [Longimicrobiales bacterium]|nr:PIN domain-containing protein [Longimicrobiales bacterium]
MKCILDTHFLLWITIDASRLSEFPWLKRYSVWGVSPVSFLEVKYLAEVGRLEVDIDAFTTAVMNDARFIVDEVPLLTLIQRALPLHWTRDPFDRLLVAHSIARRTPLCTVDRDIRRNHTFLPDELMIEDGDGKSERGHR